MINWTIIHLCAVFTCICDTGRIAGHTEESVRAQLKTSKTECAEVIQDASCALHWTHKNCWKNWTKERKDRKNEPPREKMMWRDTPILNSDTDITTSWNSLFDPCIYDPHGDLTKIYSNNHHLWVKHHLSYILYIIYTVYYRFISKFCK